MEIKNIIEQANPLFKRKEVEVLINAEITPSYEQTLPALAEKFSTNPETIKIKAIYGSVGSKTFKVLANIYESKEDKESTERKSKKEAELEKKKTELKEPTGQQPSEQPTTPESTPDTNNKENSEPSAEAKEKEQ
jgi:ribosomal protein S24E